MVGNENLLLLPRKTLLTTRFVCPQHFEDRMFWDKFKARLHRFAIPCISIPPPLIDSVMAGFDNPFALLQCPSSNSNVPVSAAHQSLSSLLNVPLISPPQSSSSPPNLSFCVPPLPSVNIPSPPPSPLSHSSSSTTSAKTPGK